MVSTPTDQQLMAAWREFRELLEAGAPERVWQKFLATHPYVLSRSLPLKLMPVTSCPVRDRGARSQTS